MSAPKTSVLSTYVPEDWSRRAIPAIAKRMGTALARKEVLDAERSAQLKERVEAEADRLSKTIILQCEKRMERMCLELQSVRAEAHRS